MNHLVHVCLLDNLCPRNRRLLLTTKIELKAIAPAARIGLRKPNAAALLFFARAANEPGGCRQRT